MILLGPDEEQWLAKLRAALPQALFPEWDCTDPHGGINTLLDSGITEEKSYAASDFAALCPGRTEVSHLTGCRCRGFATVNSRGCP